VVALGFWAGMEDVSLSEGETQASWVHALSVGPFHHPQFGKVDVNAERVQRFADNIKARARGIDPSINYDHINEGDAAGWVKDAEARPDGLWIFVEWTKHAAQKIKDKTYRYFSSEFTDEWQDPKTQVKFKDVLIGGALTNRPFLKDLVPVNLSELVGDPVTPEQKKEGEGMDPKKLRQLLKLSEDATDADVETTLTKLSEAPATPAPVVPPAPGSEPPAEDDPNAVAKLMEQLVDTGNNPAIKALNELVKAQRNELIKLQEKQKEDRITQKLFELDELAKTRNIAIPASVHDQLRHILMKSPDSLGDMVFQNYADTIKSGVVELGERGWQRRVTTGSPRAQFEELCGEYQKLHEGVGYADAMEAVARTHPDLFDQYRDESFVRVD
jgi:phage I-like protein